MDGEKQMVVVVVLRMVGEGKKMVMVVDDGCIGLVDEERRWLSG